MKRGTDHSWDVRRYKGDTALYAHCNCGFEYNCSRTEYDKEKGFINKITFIYHYCPNCGARKKWYNEVPHKMSKEVIGWTNIIMKF